MRHNKRFRNKQAGLTLIELMIAMGIGIALVAVVIGVAASVRADNKASQLQTQILQISSQAQSLSNGTSTTGITTAALINSGKIPASWIQAGESGTSTIRSPYGFPIEIAGGSGADSNEIVISTTHVPNSACTTVSTNTRATFKRIEVGSATLNSQSNPGDVTTACAGDESSETSISFVV